MKAIFLPPKGNYSGNILWNKEELGKYENEISKSLSKLRSIGYWASCFPEGDGVTFSIEDKNIKKSENEMLADFKSSFDWLKIVRGELGDSNLELAELEKDREMKCIVIVPLEKVFIEETVQIGPYSFFCKRDLDPEPFKRLTDIENEYLQFETNLKYKDLLRLNKSFSHNDYVINKCISLAEHAMDLIRYVHSSFIKMELTPNLAGQRSDGFYSIEIIPIERTHLKSFQLNGISRPISVSNNWLGPQVDHLYDEGVDYIAAICSGDIKNEMALSVLGALRSCRQSFYSLGKESQFLNLVFTLDGLINPEWRGWKQRTYVASVLSGGCPIKFGNILKRYDQLYCDVRNKLVHEGKDFYQLEADPDKVCEEFYDYIKAVIRLISRQRFNNISDMKIYALDLLKTPAFKARYTEIISEVSVERGKKPDVPIW